MVERRNGAVVRDLTTEVTETGNVYVVAPVPASVRAAIKATGQLPSGVLRRPDVQVDKSAPTPRLAGHPDLTGNWVHTDWIELHDGRRAAMRTDAGKRLCGASIRLKTSSSTRPRGSAN